MDQRRDDLPSETHDLSGLSAAELLPIVYEELRKLAAARLAREKNSETMRPTSLVHAAYLRLAGSNNWDSKSHFFGAAALAMRRILVERARHRRQGRRGGGWHQVEGGDLPEPTSDEGDDLVELDAAMDQLEKFDQDLYSVVMLRYFAGLTVESTAELLDVAPVTIKRRWTVARLWLLERMNRGEE